MHPPPRRIDRSIRTTHVDADLPTGTRFEFADRIREEARAEPLRELLRVGPCLEDDVARRIECALDDDIRQCRQFVAESSDRLFETFDGSKFFDDLISQLSGLEEHA